MKKPRHPEPSADALLERCERAEAEAALLRQILDKLPQNLLWKNRDGVFLGCNQSAARELGLASPTEIIGKSDHELFPGSGKGEYYARMDLDVMARGEPQRHVLTQRQQESGEFAWLDTTKIPLQDDQGAVSGLLVAYEDMTHHAQVEESLQKFKQAVEQSNSSIFITDTSGVIEYVNPRFCKVYGYQASEAIGMHSRQLKSGSTLESSYRELWRNLGAGLSWHGEFRNRCKDGSTTWQAVSISPILDEAGCVTHFVSIQDDIDQLKLTQATLQNQLYFLQELIDTIPNPVFYQDVSAHYLGCNQAFEKYFATSREAIIGNTPHVFAPANLASIYHEKNLELLKNPGQQEYQTTFVRPDGSRRDIITHKATFRLSDGRLGGLVGVVQDVTDLKKLESRLRDEQEKFRHLVEDVNVIAYEADPQTFRMCYVSPQAVAFFGYPLENWYQADFRLKLIHPEDLERASSIPRTYSPEGQFRLLEYRMLRSDGQVVWIEDALRAFSDASGQPVVLRGVLIDVTQRKLSEIALREGEERFRTIADYTYAWENWVDPSGLLLWVNPSVERISGYTPAECYAMRDYPFPLFHPEERERIAERFLYAVKGAGAQEENFRFRMVRKDGVIRTCEVSWQSVCDSQGRHIGHRSSIRDITPQVEAEAEKERAEQMLRLVLDHLPQRVFWKDRNSIYLDGNKAFLDDLGLSSNVELKGKDDYAFSPPKLARRYIQDDQHVIRHNKAKLNYEETADLALKQKRWILTSKVPMQDAIGAVIGVLCMYQDITEQKDTQNKLQETMREMKAILDNAQVGIVYLVDRKFVWANRRMEEIFGYSRHALQGKETKILYPFAEDYEAFGRIAYPILAQGKSYETERMLRRRNGRLFWCHMRGSAVDQRDMGKGSIWILLDIDTRKSAERKLLELNEHLEERVIHEVNKNMEQERLLVKQSRMAAMGEMIGNIAHQWRQPLNVLGLIVQNIQMDFKEGLLDDESIDEYASNAMKAVQHMSTTIDDFRNFFLPNQNKDMFDITQAVHDTVNLLESSLKHNNIELEISGPARLDAWGYKNDFAQILLNLVNNAKDALVERKVPGSNIHIQLDSDSTHAIVQVCDNAGGVLPEIADKLFEPYTTSKPSGTGIGLYMAKSIIEQHMNGRIFFRNGKQGAEFTIIIPREEEA